jgi:hypothetical protein
MGLKYIKCIKSSSVLESPVSIPIKSFSLKNSYLLFKYTAISCHPNFTLYYYTFNGVNYNCKKGNSEHTRSWNIDRCIFNDIIPQWGEELDRKWLELRNNIFRIFAVREMLNLDILSFMIHHFIVDPVIIKE